MAEWKMLCLPSVLLLWLQIFSTTLQDEIFKGSACLITTDTKVPVKNLRSYTRQRKPVFPVDAVRFLTVKGITICSDPFQLDGLAWEEEEEDAVTGSACLNTTDTKVPVRNLCSFSIQCKPVFPVDAVRFLTIKGNTICSDPSSSWAVKSVKYLDEKKKRQSAPARRSVTAAPNTMSTINTKSAQR
ncbi:lymphotactin-like [Chanodichthys erythropterus]|uniref:lymphotactin-like n=1 Tax=Chanodichthys erythropterus TaxID=933992 RepID=UPI00351DD938